MSDLKTQVAIVGGGPGGYAAAFMAADLGMSVTLIDPEEHPGGVCLYQGCIPSKALLHAAKIIHEVRAAEALGLHFTGFQLDLDKLRAWKAEVVARLTLGLGQLAKQRKVHHLRGKARFETPKSLQVAHNDGPITRLAFENAIVATGSEEIRLPDLAMDSEHVWRAVEALGLPSVPKTLLIVGGGYIGLELGTVYAALGSRVQVAEMTSGLLPGVDRDLVRFLRKRLAQRFEAIHLNTVVDQVRVMKKGVQVTLVGPDAKGDPQVFDKVLVAVGRRPNTSDLGLEHTTVRTDDEGFIRVDAQRRTDAPHIFAIGDVAGAPMLAHKATQEGRAAAEAIAGRKVAFDPAAIPAAVFTDPDIAWAGLTETDAKRRGIDCQIVRFPWAASGRAAAQGQSDGLTKMLVDRTTERILGVGIVGDGAGELISEAVLAIEMGAVVTDVGLSMHPHPTLSETMMEAAHLFHGTATHYYAPKRGQ